MFLVYSIVPGQTSGRQQELTLAVVILRMTTARVRYVIYSIILRHTRG